ncbi:MAG: TonB-dependent receptor [Tannerella sp.]|jgi:outer membrane receptor protein involved in Fe transport|nr:TonB-dependent receptor [Tannerella sp.]
MKFTFITMLFLLTAQLLTGSTVRGIIKDLETGEELVGATVVWKENPSKGTVTGLDGSFTIESAGNEKTLLCRYVGYETAEYPVTDATSPLTVLLRAASMQLGEIVIYGFADGDSENGARNAEKRSANVLNVVSAKAIEVSPDITVANVVQRISGVTVERNSSGDGQYAILRGMDKRYSYTLVNGVKIPSPDNKNRFVPLDIFPSELLDRLEVSKTMTADMEGDATGGAVNLVMKDAPQKRQFTANLSAGYSSLFPDRDFLSFDTKSVAKRSPYEIYGENYPARATDFSGDVIKMRSSGAPPNLFGGFSCGNRLFANRLGILIGGSFQNSCRGSNSLYYNSSTATSDASNLPVLTSRNDRIYSERQTRYGIHAKLDFLFSPLHRLQWYNARMDFSNAQVRDNTKTELNIGYDPANGNCNLGFDTRFRLTHQQITNSTLKGTHRFLTGEALKIDWSAVYSKAFNEVPDNTSVYTSATVRDGTMHSISVVTTPYGAERRWEHNDDEDLAGYLNLLYTLPAGGVKIDLSTGGMFRDKQRTNFYNAYLFLPFDEDRPAMENNLIKGTDWDDYSEIKFRVHNPFGSTGNQLNYDASEEVAALYGQAKLQAGPWQAILGLRIESTRQGYHLKNAIDGVKNDGIQRYTDYLPSLQVKYSPRENRNLRASYYKSFNRPGFFEIVPYQILNEEYTERGNPELEHTIAHNADFRYEYFPRPSEQFMVGLFCKLLQKPIEYGIFAEGQGTYYSPANFGDAHNYGMEIDVTKYFHSFGVKANCTFTQSEITTNKLFNYDNPDPASSEKIQVKNVEQTRPLNGQAKHVANLSLLYKDTRYGWDAQLALSYTGDRLYAVSRYLDNDIWQGSYFQSDASLEKKFGAAVILFAKAINLLDTPMTHYLKKQNPANEKVKDYETRRNGTLVRRDYYGRNLQIGLRCHF